MASRYLALTFLWAILFTAPPAWSHAMLEHAEPPVGSVVETPPKRIVLLFDSALEPALSRVRVENAEGHPVDQGGDFVDPDNSQRLILPLPPLPPGDYQVFWVAVAWDGHLTQGDYTFTIR